MTPEEWRKFIEERRPRLLQLEKIRVELVQRYAGQLRTLLDGIGQHWSGLSAVECLQNQNYICKRFALIERGGFWQLHLWYGTATTSIYLIAEDEVYFKAQDIKGTYVRLFLMVTSWNDQGDFRLIIHNDSLGHTSKQLADIHSPTFELVKHQLDVFNSVYMSLV